MKTDEVIELLVSALESSPHVDQTNVRAARKLIGRPEPKDEEAEAKPAKKK